jgi:hypothetical protein
MLKQLGVKPAKTISGEWIEPSTEGDALALGNEALNGEAT